MTLLRIQFLSLSTPAAPSFVFRRYRLLVCVPYLPPPSPVSDETRHFSWDAILIAVLRLKRLPRSPITLRPVRTFSSRIFSSCSQLSIRLAKALLRRRKLICFGWQARLSVWQIDHRLVDCANLKERRMQKNAPNYLNIFFFTFPKERSSWWIKILKGSFHLKVRFAIRSRKWVMINK